jgi:hypothetical protein
MMLQQNAANAEIQRRQAATQLGAMISAQNQPRQMTTTTCNRVGQSVVCNQF